MKVVFLVIASTLLVLVPSYLLLFFGAFVLANSVNKFSKENTFAKIGIWSIFLAAITLSGFLFGPELNINFTEFAQQIRTQLGNFQTQLSNYDFISQADLEQVLNSSITQKVIQPLGSAFQIITLSLLLFLIAFFMTFELKQLKRLLKGFINFCTGGNKKLWQRFSGSSEILHEWMINRILSMLIVGILTFIGLLFVDVEYKVWLSILAALLSFIPNLGPILGFIPAALLAIPLGKTTLISVAVIYLIVQILESNVITPLIFKNNMRIPITLTFLFQLIFGSLFGFLGLTFAVPLGLFIMHLIELPLSTEE